MEQDYTQSHSTAIQKPAAEPISQCINSTLSDDIISKLESGVVIQIGHLKFGREGLHISDEKLDFFGKRVDLVYWHELRRDRLEDYEVKYYSSDYYLSLKESYLENWSLLVFDEVMDKMHDRGHLPL